MSRSVDRSAIPRRTTVVPKSERNPSAAEPQRTRAWERSWRQASTRSPCPAPSLTIAGRSGIGAMLATSSRARSVGGPGTPVAGSCIGGVADVADRRHHERRELLLAPARRADVQGVRSAAEGLEVEGRRERRRQGPTGAVRPQHARCGGPDARLLPGVGSHDPGEHIGRRRALFGPRGENFERWGRIVTFDPMKELRHGEALCRRGMEEGREECAGTLGPVVLPRTRGAHAAGRDHRVGGHDSCVPTRGGRQRRPPDALDTVWAFDLAARVVEQCPPVAAPRRRRCTHDVGLRRRRDDGAFGEQNIGYDQGRRLP